MTRTTSIAGAIALIGVVILRLPLTQAAAAEPGWREYADPSSRTRVDYPAGIFSVAEGPFRFGSGEGFGTADGRAHLAVFTMKAEKGGSPAASSPATCRCRAPPCIISGSRRGSLRPPASTRATSTTSRCNSSSSDRSTLHCIYLIYPTAEKRAWDPMVTRISRTLRP